MKILIVYRTEKDATGKSVKEIKERFEKAGHKVDLISREDDLNLYSLSSSMGSLSAAIEKKDKENSYNIIYTQDWSIAFPLLIPTRILSEKHYCLFHNIEPSGAKSRILQKIAGNMMGDKLIVKTQQLREKFPKAAFSPDGLAPKTIK